ncbi:MAG: hypothetical protein CSA34_01155 [Desulfobulbus propionicus]|nr:MAG: hypothetical protein CSA34_01155 [Desulfobulbus propionicus]
MQQASHHLFFIVLVLLCTTLPVSASIELNQVGRIDEEQRLQLFLRFSQLPSNKIVCNGKRIDIIMEETTALVDLQLPEADSRLIRMFIKQEASHLVLSLFFRYKPQQYSSSENQGTASLLVDILLGNPLSARYPDLSASFAGITVLHRSGTNYTSPVQVSAFAANWKSLFEHYESPLQITPQLRLSLPPFPLAGHAARRKNLEIDAWLPASLQELAASQQWSQLQLELRERLATEKNQEYKKLLLLTYAEVLVRSGGVNEPYHLLQKIILEYPDTLLAYLGEYLFHTLQAQHGDPHQAAYEMNKLDKRMKAAGQNPFPAYSNILQAEMAIMTNNLKKAEELLDDDTLPCHSQTCHLRRMRQADLLFMRHERVKALVSYLQLTRESSLIDTYPRSLANFAAALYKLDSITKAVSTYGQLNLLLAEADEQQDLTLYRLAVSRLQAGEKLRQVEPLFMQIRSSFPGSEGSQRAELKETDLLYLAHALNEEEAARIYQRLQDTAVTVALRAEAMLKKAVISSFQGLHQQSVEEAMLLLREFASSELRVDAKALIIQQLPKVITELVSDKEYLQALVLAKKNRELFIRGWLSQDLLYDLGHAYQALGFYKRAIRTYNYLFDLAKGEELERIYPLLLTSLYGNEQYTDVENYAEQFFFRYPESKLSEEVYLLWLQALAASGRNERLEQLLAQKNRPANTAIDLLAARHCFLEEDWEAVIGLLDRVSMQEHLKDPDTAYMLAESAYQQGRFDLAAKMFGELLADGQRTDQSQYRLAGIALLRGDRETGRNQLTELVKKGKDRIWTRMAQEDLKIETLKQR